MELVRFPTVTVTPVIDTATMVVWPYYVAEADGIFVNMEEYDEITFAITNTAGNATTAGKLQWAPDAEDAHVEDIHDFGAISAGATESHTLTQNTKTYMRIIATGAATPNGATLEINVTAKRKVN